MLSGLATAVAILFCLGLAIPGSIFRYGVNPEDNILLFVFICFGTVIAVVNSKPDNKFIPRFEGDEPSTPIWFSATALASFVFFLVLESNSRAAMGVQFEGKFVFAPFQALAALVTLGFIFMAPVWLCANIGSRWRRYTKPLMDLPMEE